MKKFLPYILILGILFSLAVPVYHIFAQTAPDTTYHLLAPLGELKTFNPGSGDTPGAGDLGKYLNIIIPIFIGLCAVLAVVMIVLGGMQYMTSELISSKEEGKKRIWNAIFGLLLALGAWLILNTINPNLLKTDLSSLEGVTVTNDIQPNSTYEKPATPENTARCKEAPSPCSTADLTSAFGDKAAGMSKICNMESGGQNIPSGTDVCSDGSVFSFGLLQINLLSNGTAVNTAGANCAELFNVKKGPYKLAGSNRYDCSLKPGADVASRYNACKSTLLTPSGNLAAASVLFQQGKSPPYNDPMFAWSGDKAACGSAWN